MGQIEIPSFDWSAYYYGEILEALLAFKRVHAPEFTDESPQDPLIQALRAYACVGHLNSCDLDVLGNENTLPTSRLPENVRNMLRLIDYEMASASPSEADVVLKLRAALAAATTVVFERSQVSTRRTADEAAVVFEVLEELAATRSDLGHITKVLALYNVTSAFTDYTAEANSAPGDDFAPWPAPPDGGDMLYIGHADVMFDQIGVELDTNGDDYDGRWEYYNGEVLDGKPDSVERVGSTLRFVVNGVVGVSEALGLVVRVQLDKTGAYEDCVSQWGDLGSGDVNYIVTSTLLGQTIGEADLTSVADYTVGSEWNEVPDLDDGTDAGTGGMQTPLSQPGDVKFSLPESLVDKWQKTTIEEVEAYWVRMRVVANGTPTTPVIDRLRIDQGGQYVKTTAVQGQTQNDPNLGTADGVTPNQSFETTRDGFIDGSETVTVGGTVWTRVSNFLQSKPTDRHYKVALGERDRASYKFGNGVNGAIPSGQVASVYRYGVETDGNVGAGTITQDKSGLASVASLWNPRPAVGWQQAESATEATRERAKVAGPASLRSGEVALGPEDVEDFTVNRYTDPDTGAKPFTRSTVIEGSFGPKTMENVVVGAGGNPATAAQLAALDLWLNGDKYASPPVRSRVVANQEVTSTNFAPRTIGVRADVYGASSTSAIEDALEALLQPETRQEDGVSFEWEFGGDIFLSRITHEIFAADPGVTRVENLELHDGTSWVAANVPLGSRELPVAGTVTITAA